MGHYSSPRSTRIAIVGGGISGIACLWTLRDHPCIVDLYEADNRLGGHANSVPFEGNGRKVDVDTGFIAMDEDTYPQFCQFLRDLNVETIPTDMSFGVSISDGQFEWGSKSISSFVGQLSTLLKPWFWRLVFDVLRFSFFAEEILYEYSTPSTHNLFDKISCQATNGHEDKIFCSRPLESIGDYLNRMGYSKQFIECFLIPMVAAPWCIDPERFARTFPARPLIEFMLSHRLLDTVTKTLRWRSFRNGSKTYVDAFIKSLPSQHRLTMGTRVQSVSVAEKVSILTFADGTSKRVDYVVLAVHAKDALALLGDGATDAQRKILSAFETSKNICYLHSDTSLLPKRAPARVAWNCFLQKYPSGKLPCERKSTISLTFDMNKLQGIPNPGEHGSPGKILVSMNPIRIPHAPQSQHVYYHPLITSKSVQVAPHIREINNSGSIKFAGAWMGFGFHEDGFASGAHAARLIMHGYENTAPLDLFSNNVRLAERSHLVVWYRWLIRLVILTIQRILQIFGAVGGDCSKSL